MELEDGVGMEHTQRILRLKKFSSVNSEEFGGERIVECRDNPQKRKTRRKLV